LKRAVALQGKDHEAVFVHEKREKNLRFSRACTYSKAIFGTSVL